MVNIKSYKDGDRLILVIENCTGDLAIQVNKFLAEIIGLKNSSPKEVPALVSIPVNDEPMPEIDTLQQAHSGDFIEPPTDEEIKRFSFSDGAYKGMSVYDALKQDGIKAAVRISSKSNLLPKNIKGKAIEICKKSIAQDLCLKNTSTASRNEIYDFFTLYSPIIEDGIKQILCMSGYSSLSDFFAFADENTLKDAYEGIVLSLREKIL